MKTVSIYATPDNPFTSLVSLGSVGQPYSEEYAEGEYTPTPTATIKVDDLPGFTDEMPGKLRASDTVLSMWERVNRLAWETMGEEVKNALAGTLTFERVIAQTAPLVERPFNYYEYVLPTPRYEGWELHFPSSKWVYLELEYVQIESVYHGNTTLKIWNLSTGEEVYSKSLEVKGNKVIEIGIKIALQRASHLLIAIDCEGLTLRPMDTNECWCDFYTGEKVTPINSNGRWKVDGNFRLFPVGLAKAEPLIYKNILLKEELRSSLGMDLRLNASMELFLTEYARELKNAYRYLVAYKIMDEKLGTHELNHWAKNNLQFTREKRDDWKADFEKTVARAIKALPLAGQSLLYQCDQEESGSISIGSMI